MSTELVSIQLKFPVLRLTLLLLLCCLLIWVWHAPGGKSDAIAKGVAVPLFIPEMASHNCNERAIYVKVLGDHSFFINETSVKDWNTARTRLREIFETRMLEGRYMYFNVLADVSYQDFISDIADVKADTPGTEVVLITKQQDGSNPEETWPRTSHMPFFPGCGDNFRPTGKYFRFQE